MEWLKLWSAQIKKPIQTDEICKNGLLLTSGRLFFNNRPEVITII